MKSLNRYALATLLTCLLAAAQTGCSGLARWGTAWGQGTVDRQKAQAAVYDPFPLNDIGPEVVGGRPREFYTPQAEATRNQHGNYGQQLYGYPR